MDCLSEIYREFEDLFGTTAPEPLDMSDQASADVLKSLDEAGPTDKILSSNGQKSEIYKKLIVYKKPPEAQGEGRRARWPRGFVLGLGGDLGGLCSARRRLLSGQRGGPGASLASEVNAKLTFMAYMRPKRRRALADVAQNLTRPFEGQVPRAPRAFFWWRGRHVVPK